MLCVVTFVENTALRRSNRAGWPCKEVWFRFFASVAKTHTFSHTPFFSFFLFFVVRISMSCVCVCVQYLCLSPFVYFFLILFLSWIIFKKKKKNSHKRVHNANKHWWCANIKNASQSLNHVFTHSNHKNTFHSITHSLTLVTDLCVLRWQDKIIECKRRAEHAGHALGRCHVGEGYGARSRLCTLQFGDFLVGTKNENEDEEKEGEEGTELNKNKKRREGNPIQHTHTHTHTHTRTSAAAGNWWSRLMVTMTQRARSVFARSNSSACFASRTVALGCRYATQNTSPWI